MLEAKVDERLAAARAEYAALEAEHLALMRHLDAANLRERRLEAERVRHRDAIHEAIVVIEDEPSNVRSLLPILRTALEGGRR